MTTCCGEALIGIYRFDDDRCEARWNLTSSTSVGARALSGKKTVDSRIEAQNVNISDQAERETEVDRSGTGLHRYGVFWDVDGCLGNKT